MPTGRARIRRQTRASFSIRSSSRAGSAAEPLNLLGNQGDPVIPDLASLAWAALALIRREVFGDTSIVVPADVAAAA